MLLLLLFDFPSWPTAVLAIVVAIFTALKGIELYQGKSKKALEDERNHWKEISAAAQTEATLKDQALARVRAEKESVTKEKDDYRDKAARLETQTDLRPIIERITSWIDEGRLRFDESMVELQSTRKMLSEGQTTLFTEMKAQRMTFESGFKAYTDEFVAHTREDHESWAKLLGMFRVMEDRMNHLAVKVGIARWPDHSLTQVAPGGKIPSSEKPGDAEEKTRTPGTKHRPDKH